MRYQKRPVLALAAALVAGPVVILAASGAEAAVVDVDYQCRTPIGPKGAVSPIEITSQRNGGGYRLTMSFRKGVSASPVELGKGAMTPSATIKVAGADSGTVTVTGPPNAAAIPADSPIRIGDLSGTYTPRASGKVTFTPGVLTIRALGTETVCTPRNDPRPSLELQVTAAGGAGDAGDGGELPRTGPLESAVALGTLGGTVVLTGVAGVLWLTRRGARRTTG
ncbi:peptidase [Streptomyces sp. NPDC057638]|uniref:peptidase n=1 Tax=Streptomyces sp. NPDC057638 TaxID=3346190 RepID=UPI0036D0EEFB